MNINGTSIGAGPVNGGNGGATARIGTVASTTATATVTATATTTPHEDAPPVLRLTLRNQPAVRWDESVVDNEGMGRKSSKRCCIFHKQRAYDESSTDTSDQEDDEGNNGGHRRPIARPKKSNHVPDFQRFHA